MSDNLYDPSAIEPKWQRYWQQHKTFKTAEDRTLPKYYVLDMFPYPSGDGLHVGHVEGYTATDIVARYKRMCGFNVLHPMGWDAFGLPAEQYAIKTGTHPRETTARNVARFKKQLQALGLSYDWEREINTTAPQYYRWTQWIFQELYKAGLAYQAEQLVNFCPTLGTVLANEEVIDGKSEVGGFPVVKRPMRQWVLKITSYAERLLNDLDLLDWSDSVKEMQRNWIGKSQGAEIIFGIDGREDCSFSVFSTRPDTLFGATFCVLAPEHPLLQKITTAAQQTTVQAYIDAALAKSERERAQEASKKGAFTGSYALHPVTKQKLPIYVADYVLMDYGSGAIMAVPAHDERDMEFAREQQLEIKQVITGGEGEQLLTGYGKCINSDFLNGLAGKEAITKMCAWLEEHGCGKSTVRYKLRDWLFARQRYWGEPFPLYYDRDGNVVLVAEDELPVVLPELDDFSPGQDGNSPLAKCQEFVAYRQGKREVNTMPQWAGSCWYYLRYLDPHNDKMAWDKEKERYWLPVDLYVGGVEHAVLHLLYARFWHKVLYDLGHVSSVEPFQRLVNQGTILGTNQEKMSKSRGNVVNPDDVIKEWGADSLRLYEMFMGPLEATKPWQTKGIVGCQRFLQKVWRIFASPRISKTITASPLKRDLQRLIKTVTHDTDKMRFNTAIASMMEFMNTVSKTNAAIAQEEAEMFLLLLAPYAPHLCEELWQRLGHSKSIALAAWPDYDPQLATQDKVSYSVQFNGRHRFALQLDKDCDQAQVEALVMEHDSYARLVEGKTVVKKIYVPNKIINFVCK